MIHLELSKTNVIMRKISFTYDDLSLKHMKSLIYAKNINDSKIVNEETLFENSHNIANYVYELQNITFEDKFSSFKNLETSIIKA